MERPDFCTDEYLEFLDELREEGTTNMFGAAPFLMEVYPELTKEEARKILGYWAETFGKEER